MNPPPPIPAHEGEVPPRLSIRYRCNYPYERFIQFNFDGEKITCSGANGRVGKGAAIEELYCLADNLGVASRELITAFLSAEKQRALRAVEEARAKAFEEVCQKWESTAVDTSEYVYWIFEERRKAKAQASRAAKEPS